MTTAQRDIDLVQLIIQEHRELERSFAEAERLMKDLEDVDPADAKFDQLTGRLIADLRQHFQHEEEQLLPRVKKACSPQELRTLGNSVALAKEVAPTRPHPAAPDKPPANLVIGPGVGIIDRVRDVLSGRQT